MWRKYLHPNSIIVGIDIGGMPLLRGSLQIFMRIGDQGARRFGAVGRRLAPLTSLSTTAAIRRRTCSPVSTSSLPRGMKDEGIYIVEDFHTSYHPGFVGKHLPFLDIVKHLIDAMHAHYHRMHRLPGGAFLPDSESSFLVPRITTTLDQMRIFDSMVVLYRKVGRQTPVSELARAAARRAPLIRS